MNAILRKYVGEFRSGPNLNGGEAELFLDSMISESDEAILAEIFRAWNQKGIDEDEIYSIAKVMRGRCVKRRFETYGLGRYRRHGRQQIEDI